jgi:exodeoxyribonuclease V alpha subunit
LRVALAAPTGKAAARLKQSIDVSLKALQVQSVTSHSFEPGVGTPAALDLDTLIQRIGPARTLHSLLGARPDTRLFRHHAANLLDVDVLIVDEASMVHLEMMDALLQALPPTARLVLLGDKDQLASVEAGAVLGDVCRDAAQGAYQAETLRYAQALAGQSLASFFQALPTQAVSDLAQQTVMLRQSRRFDGPIGQLALAVNAGDVDAAWACFQGTSPPNGPLLALQPDSPEAVCALALGMVKGTSRGPSNTSGKSSYLDYLKCLQQGPAGQHPGEGEVECESESESEGPAEDPHAAWVRRVLRAFDRFRILCAVHQGEWGTTALNAAVQKALADAGWLQPQGEWFAGRPVMVTRNDAQLGVFNGDVGVVLPSPQGVLKVWFADGEQLRSVSVSRLAHADTAFVMTVHKSQGSEFAHTALVLPPGAADVLTRELVYTGITRAREQFTLIEGQPGLLDAAMARPSVRVSGLRLWWA